MKTYRADWKPVAHPWPLDEERAAGDRLEEAGYSPQVTLGTDLQWNPIIYCLSEEAPDQEQAPFVVHLRGLGTTDYCILCASLGELVAVVKDLAPIGQAAIHSELHYDRDFHIRHHRETHNPGCLYCLQMRPL